MPKQTPDIRRALLQQLESFRRVGVRELPRVDTSLIEVTEVASLGDADTADPTVKALSITEELVVPDTQQSSASTQEGSATTEQAGLLHVLQQEVAGCTRCSELASARTQTVFGVGHPDARVVFFGEAPGADEDRLGEPFVGRAGQLLTKIIAACTWARDDVYILNTLKCRPPSNRNPEPDELHNCRPFWQRQLEIIQPDYIVCLGKFAMQELLDTRPTQSIGKMRKAFHKFGDIKVVVTYHPSYLLRNPAAKKDVWDDMKMLMADMGIDVPQKPS